MGDPSAPTRDAVVAVYTRLLEAWNARDVRAFVVQFTDHGSTVGFDGRPQLGEELTAELTAVHRAGEIVDAR